MQHTVTFSKEKHQNYLGFGKDHGFALNKQNVYFLAVCLTNLIT